MQKPEMTTEARIARSMRNHMLFGLLLTAGMFGGIVAWSATTEISGAVVAAGQVAVESSAKKVQHLEGGTIARLNVREGDRVIAGDVVARLDDTQLKAGLAIVTKALNEFSALEARLIAERDGKPVISFPPALVDIAQQNADAAASIAGQTTIFDSRRMARESAKTQLAEQIAQLASAINGLETQQAAREKELEFIGRELEGLRDLFSRQLVSIQRVNALERDRTRIDGERGKLIADIATSRGSISEKRVQILRLDDDFRSEVVRELADVRGKINENIERKIASEDRLSRVDIRAPATGQIHQLNVFTVGGVISPGEALMLIIPEKDKLIVDAQIDPQDIEHVYVGQHAHIHFSGFADRNIRDGQGQVSVISPDLVEDSATRRKFYRLKLTVEPPVGMDGKPFVLVPGMPIEGYLAKGDKTVLAYLLKPLKDQLRRVWRE